MTTTDQNVVTATFVQQKETPGTIKFQEVPPKGQPPVSGSLYLKKYVVENLGNPEIVTMTITAG